MALLSDLVGPYEGKPILVICGGASAARHFPEVYDLQPALVLSANEHGFKQDRFKIDFIVSVDYWYGSTRERMDKKLAGHKTPHINRWSWADYRIPEWNFNGDSGLTAIAVAVMLGGHPVVALGIDRMTGPKKYFWQNGPDPQWAKKVQPHIMNIREHVRRSVEFCKDAQVRIFHGPMLEYWKPYSPAETLPQWVRSTAPQVTLRGKMYNRSSQIFLHPSDPVSSGQILLTDNEAHPHLKAGKITCT